MRKWFALLGLVLFLGVAVAPGINGVIGQESLEDEYVEYITEVCGLPGLQPQTVKLTRQQADEVEHLFDSINSKLNNTTSRGDYVVIFKQAIIELNKYGLLPKGMSVERANKVVTGFYQNNLENVLDRKLQSKIFSKVDNVFCLLYGTAAITDEYSDIFSLSPLMILWLGLFWISEWVGLYTLYNLTILLDHFLLKIPLRLLNWFSFAECDVYIESLGLKGFVLTHGLFVSIYGYTGLVFFSRGNKIHFLGFALIIS